mgnify:CR=1 FL=1
MLRFRRSIVTTGLLCALFAGPLVGRATAHALAGSRFDAPLPLPLLLLGAGATVGLTALWLGRTERSSAPTLDREVVWLRGSTVAVAKQVAAVLFLVGVLGALAAGVLGRQVAAENPATVFTWAVWFRGLALVAIAIGSPWSVLSPWRTVVDALAWVEGEELSAFSLPSVGTWPATIGFLTVFGIVENLTNVPLVPRLTTVLLVGYAAVMLGGAVLFGSAWLSRADPLSVLYRLFGSVSPVAVAQRDQEYAVSLRYPWEGALSPVRGPGVVTFAVGMVYVVSFDGFTETAAFQTVLFRSRALLGLGPATTLVLFGVGFAAFLGAFLAGCWLSERVGSDRPAPVPATTGFAPTLLPIAAAYEVAHNYPYVARSTGQLLELLLDSVGPGLGPIEPLAWLPLPAFWASQVLLIVLGHVVAVVAAHFVAVRRYGSVAAARRGHLPLVVLMIGYTVLSLWIVSQPVVA